MGGGYFTTRWAAVCVGCFWLFIIISNGPQFIWADVYTSRFSRNYCGMPNVEEKTLQIYSAVKIVFAFLIPLIITWISYCKIVYKSHKTWKTVIALTIN